MSLYLASAWIERQAGAGEDAQPLALESDAWHLAAVFDGLGGSGSRVFTRTSDGRSATGAAFAAESAAQAAARAFAQLGPMDAPPAAFEQVLQSAIEDGQRQLVAATRTESRVSGAMMLAFPTTACILLARRSDTKGSIFWVGDSRAFAWGARQGVSLLTWEGAGEAEATARLVGEDGRWRDAPNTSVVSGERAWGFALSECDLAHADLVLLCSDGLYGAFGAPLELDRAVRAVVLQSDSLADAALALQQLVDPLKQDDVSFVLYCPSGDWARVRASAVAVGDTPRLAHPFLAGPAARPAQIAQPPAAPAPVVPPPPKPQAPQRKPPRMNMMLGIVGWAAAIAASIALLVVMNDVGTLRADNARLSCELAELRAATQRNAPPLSRDCRALLRAPD